MSKDRFVMGGLAIGLLAIAATLLAVNFAYQSQALLITAMLVNILALVLIAVLVRRERRPPTSP